MFKLKFAKMFDNIIFTKYGLCPVAEDYFSVNNLSFCVADGVTRDDINGNAVEYPETELEAREWIKNYPNPSGSYKAAKIICDEFIKEINNYKESEITEKSVKKSINKANECLNTININRKIDYLKDDLYCCVAVGGVITNNTLVCFSIGDCHICVLDEYFNLLFETINNHKQFEEYVNNTYIKQNSFDWNNPKDRVLVRKEYRNNPQMKYKGKDISFGVLSGEKNAEYYIDTYTVNLENAKFICAYSDGCEAFFENKEKRKQLLNNLDSVKLNGKERTLVVYENRDSKF